MNSVFKFLTVMFVLIALGCLWMSGVTYAQEKPAAAPTTAVAPAVPVLSEMDALKIENAMLKVQAATQQLEAMKASFQSLLSSLQKPGYVIAQGQDGKLVYQPEPKPEPKK